MLKKRETERKWETERPIIIIEIKTEFSQLFIFKTGKTITCLTRRGKLFLNESFVLYFKQKNALFMRLSISKNISLELCL